MDKDKFYQFVMKILLYKLGKKCIANFIKILNYFTLAVHKILDFSKKHTIFNKSLQIKKYLDRKKIKMRNKKIKLISAFLNLKKIFCFEKLPKDPLKMIN